MRILYITHLTERNGATIALRNIMRGMVERGVEIGLIAPYIEGFICDEVRALGAPVLCNYPYPWAMLKGYISFRHYITAHWKTYQLIKSFKPDLVHCNSGIIDYTLLGCILTHTPMIWHNREYIDLFFNQPLYGGLLFHKKKLKLPFVHCIAITNGVFQHFELKEPKDSIVYDGVIDEKAPQLVESKDTTVRYFLFVGSFIEGKGVHVIFDQFASVHQQYPDVELWLACRYSTGSEYYKSCIDIAVQNGFSGKVKFLGFCTDVASLMSNAVAIIVPSRFEAFGFITVEAMHNNCLVIGRNTAGTKEQFDKGLEETGAEIGLRFENDEELPMLMKRTLDGDFQEMRCRAKSLVDSSYTIDKHNNRLYFLYANLLIK